MYTVAIIPAKGTNREIPNKHLLAIGPDNVPVINYTVEAAANALLVDEVVVASDSDKILATASKEAAKYPTIYQSVRLPSYMCQQHVQADEAVLNAWRQLQERYGSVQPDIVVVLQPTSIFRTPVHIDEAIQLYLDIHANQKPFEKKDIVFSGYDPGWTYDMELSDRQRASSWLIDPRTRLGREDEDESGYVTENGAIYVIDAKLFSKNKSFRAKEMVPYYMGKYSSLELDTYEDLIVAKAMLAAKVKVHV